MHRLEVSGAVRPMYGSLGVRRLKFQVEYPSNRQLVPSVKNNTGSYSSVQETTLACALSQKKKPSDPELIHL